MKVAARSIGGGRDGAQEKRAGPGKAEDNMGTNKKTRGGMEKPGLWSQAPDSRRTRPRVCEQGSKE